MCVCFARSVPPGQSQWRCHSQQPLSGLNVIISRLGSEWSGRWSPTTSSSHGIHREATLSTPFLSFFLFLFIHPFIYWLIDLFFLFYYYFFFYLTVPTRQYPGEQIASWLNANERVSARDPPPDGARDLFCIFGGARVASTVEQTHTEQKQTNTHVDVIQTIKLVLNKVIFICTGSIPLSFALRICTSGQASNGQTMVQRPYVAH